MIKGHDAATDATQAVIRVDGTESSPNKDEKTTTLQIKCAQLQRTFIMKFPYSTTIAQVLSRLEHESEAPIAEQQYQLQTTFPKKVLDDTSATLEAAGLVPNCALILVRTSQ